MWSSWAWLSRMRSTGAGAPPRSNTDTDGSISTDAVVAHDEQGVAGRVLAHLGAGQGDGPAEPQVGVEERGHARHGAGRYRRRHRTAGGRGLRAGLAPPHPRRAASRPAAAASPSTGDRGQLVGEGTQATRGPLTGVRVIDLSAVVSGPFGTSILADQGADVIIGRAGPRRRRRPLLRPAGRSADGVSAYWASMNRNKRAIALDLKHAGGQALLKDLVAEADVRRAELPARGHRPPRASAGTCCRRSTRSSSCARSAASAPTAPTSHRARPSTPSCSPSPATPWCRPTATAPPS